MRFASGRRFGQIRGPILDVTAEAREAAKAQAAATAAGVMDENLLDEIAAELGGGDAPPPAERRASRARPPEAEAEPVDDALRERIRRSRAATVRRLRAEADG
ncbi:MAG TPA: hypothetical protein VJT75_16610 [Thermoleophilaceae bacterium]|nr:hypothetical protein [Thermoleophilaceae bacterium]